MLELALGILGWSPAQFWDATCYELSCAWVGRFRYKSEGPWTKEIVDAAAMKAELADLQERFPDGPADAEQKRFLKLVKG